jgi:ferredoxin
MGKKVTIRREECISCETCWTTAPEFFQQNGADQWSEVVEKYRIGGNNAEGEAPDDLLGKIQESADSCPVAIIEIG